MVYWCTRFEMFKQKEDLNNIVHFILLLFKIAIF